jgi:hypothetical protein
MDFKKLYSLIVEEDETVTGSPHDEQPVTSDDGSINDDGTGIPEPDNYNVEPAPMAPTVDHGETAQSIISYINKLETFADELNGTDGSSLNDYINKIDVSGGAYEGISTLKKKIISAAVDLRSIIEDLNGYRIASQKAASAVPAPVAAPAPAPVATA